MSEVGARGEVLKACWPVERDGKERLRWGVGWNWKVGKRASESSV